MKSLPRLISHIFKNTFTIHVHKDDVDTTEENPEKFSRALCSATDTGILDGKCNSSVSIKHINTASTRFTSVKARAFLQHVDTSIHSWVFALLPVNIPDPHFWVRRGNSVLKANRMLGTLLSRAGADWNSYGLSNCHLPGQAGRGLHPSSRSQQSHQNRKYDFLVPWPCAKQGGGTGLSRWLLPALPSVPWALRAAATTAGLLQEQPLILPSAVTTASILLFPMTPVRAGFGQNNVSWRNHPSFSLFQIKYQALNNELLGCITAQKN